MRTLLLLFIAFSGSAWAESLDCHAYFHLPIEAGSQRFVPVPLCGRGPNLRAACFTHTAHRCEYICYAKKSERDPMEIGGCLCRVLRCDR